MPTDSELRAALAREADVRCGPAGWDCITVVFTSRTGDAETVVIRPPQSAPADAQD